MKQRILEWVAGIDEDHKDIIKTAGKAVTSLLDFSSRLVFQLPHEKDSSILRTVKCVAIVDSAYKALKGEDEEEKNNNDNVTNITDAPAAG